MSNLDSGTHLSAGVVNVFQRRCMLDEVEPTCNACEYVGIDLVKLASTRCHIVKALGAQ